MWKLKERDRPPPPPEGATVDVFITVYNEPLDLVRGDGDRSARDRLPAPDLHPRRRREPRDGADGARGGHRLRHADRRLEGPPAPREGRQPQQRAVSDHRRVPADPRRRPDPDAGDARQDARVVSRPARRPRADAAVLHQRPRRGSDGQPGAAVLRADPAGQGRLERRVLLRLERHPAARGAHAARDRRLRPGGRAGDAPRPAHRPHGAAPGALRGSRARHPGGDARARRAGARARRRPHRAADGSSLQEATHAFRREVDAISRGMVSGDVARDDGRPRSARRGHHRDRRRDRPSADRRRGDVAALRARALAARRAAARCAG